MIESSASAESWREDSQADDKEELAAERARSGTETDMKDQPLQSRLPQDDESVER